jgi:hypothetical protein
VGVGMWLSRPRRSFSETLRVLGGRVLDLTDSFEAFLQVLHEAFAVVAQASADKTADVSLLAGHRWQCRLTLPLHQLSPISCVDTVQNRAAYARYESNSLRPSRGSDERCGLRSSRILRTISSGSRAWALLAVRARCDLRGLGLPPDARPDRRATPLRTGRTR